MLSTLGLLAPADALDMLGFLANTSLKATLLLGAAGTLAVMLKKSPASTRHVVWGIGLSALLALPVLPFLLPRLNVPVWLPTLGSPILGSKQTEPAPARSGLMTIEVSPESGAGALAHNPSKPLNNPIRPSLSDGSSAEHIASQAVSGALDWRPYWGVCLLLVWLIGVLVSLSRWIIGLFGALMIVRRSRPVVNADCIADLAGLSGSSGLGRRVRLIEYEGASMPMTCGIIRPVIVLPISHSEWPPERRRVILLHELSHVKRWDCLVQAIAQIACSVYWLNPLVWLAARRLRIESENACDDAVISSGTRASAYAGHLLEIARSFSGAHSSPRAALTIARPSQLESRLRSILSPARPNQRRPERLRSGLVSLGLLSLALALAAMTPYPRSAAATGKAGLTVLEQVWERDSARTATGAADDQRNSDGAAIPQSPKQTSGDAARASESKPATPEDARPDGPKQTLEEKESTFLSQRVVESYTKSSSIESSSLDQDSKSSAQKTSSDAAVEALTGALKDKDSEVRSNAIWALSMHGRIAQDALIAALKDEDARVRAQAAWGLGMHGNKDAVDPLIAALKDTNPRVVSQAAWALGMRGDVRAVDALKALLNNPNDDVRRQAAWALGMLLMRSGGGDGDENEDESDGDGSSDGVPSPRPHPHSHVNAARGFRRAN